MTPESAKNKAPVAADGALSMQEASQALNVPAPTIRSWERRYGVPVADRSRGGHRRYTGDQLDRLRLMRDLIAQGRRPVDAATQVKAGLPTSPGPLVEAFLQGACELAPDSIGHVLEVARANLGLDRTVDEVLLPAMRRVGEWWHAGRIDVAHEHLATHATRAWLATLAPTDQLRPEPPIILGCGPSDHHTLALEAMAALLRSRHWDCRLLGARTPVESLRRAVRETDAAAVVLVCHLAAGRAAAVEALRRVERPGTQLFYAGGSFATRGARRRVPGRYLGTHLARAADLVTDVVVAASAGRAR